jgi:uracil-DNA glycosylase family 4
MSDRRNAVFLEEMGVGPQWRLRNRPVSAAAAAAPEECLPPAVPELAPVAAAAPQVVPQVAPEPVAAPPASVPVQRAAPQAPAEVALPPAAPAAPARAPGTPSIASTGEDMSWFDDAPTPEYKPQRKKGAAPEQAAAAPPPPRPVPVTAPAQRAPQRAAPAGDDLPMEEPPSWFDDEQPAAPGAPAPAVNAGEDIARMDWPALQAAVASCTRCARCETRRQAVPGRGDEQASWIALDIAPGPSEDAEGYQFAGDPGYLLDNMLKAVGQATEQGAYLTSLVKCHAPHAPSAEELQACRPFLQRELELTQAKVIVAFGHATGKGLLGGAARGRIMLHGSVPVVATYHPADLLKKPEEKAKAWQDLCLAKAAHAGRR